MFTFEQSPQNCRFTFIFDSLFEHTSLFLGHTKSGLNGDRFVLLNHDRAEIVVKQFDGYFNRSFVRVECRLMETRPHIVHT